MAVVIESQQLVYYSLSELIRNLIPALCLCAAQLDLEVNLLKLKQLCDVIEYNICELKLNFAEGKVDTPVCSGGLTSIMH